MNIFNSILDILISIFLVFWVVIQKLYEYIQPHYFELVVFIFLVIILRTVDRIESDVKKLKERSTKRNE